MNVCVCGLRIQWQPMRETSNSACHTGDTAESVRIHTPRRYRTSDDIIVRQSIDRDPVSSDGISGEPTQCG